MKNQIAINEILKNEASLYKKLYQEKLLEIENLTKTVDQMQKASKEASISLEELSISHVNLQRKWKVIEKVFTQNQIQLLTGDKKRVNWTAKEICDAFTIRYHSQITYKLLRQEFGFPLPCLSSLRSWSSKIDMRHGVLQENITLMGIVGSNMDDMEKVCVLAFDEMAICESVEKDVLNDEVIGPHKNMHCVMARGLFSKWKQLVFVDFDVQMTLAILTDIISLLHFSGYRVVACVSDCGGGNQGLWYQQIKISIDQERTYMRHPMTGKEIFMFADAPHLLKLFRNWLLDTGFQLGSGKLKFNFWFTFQ